MIVRVPLLALCAFLAFVSSSWALNTAPVPVPVSNCIVSVLRPLVELPKAPIKESKGSFICRDIRETLNRTAKPGERVGDGKNVAFAQFKISGQEETLVAVSGETNLPGLAPVPKGRVFNTFVINGDRANDAEVKLLEKLALRLKSESTGIIKIYSERPFCKSCQNVIDQFRRRFPKVELIVSSGTMNRAGLHPVTNLVEVQA